MDLTTNFWPLVVQKMDSTIDRINHCPEGINIRETKIILHYPVDRDLSGG